MTNHNSALEKSKYEQKEFIARAVKNINTQSTVLMKFNGSRSNIIAASFIASNVTAKHGKSFSKREYIKKIIVQLCTSSLRKF